MKKISLVAIILVSSIILVSGAYGVLSENTAVFSNILNNQYLDISDDNNLNDEDYNLNANNINNNNLNPKLGDDGKINSVDSYDDKKIADGKVNKIILKNLNYEDFNRYVSSAEFSAKNVNSFYNINSEDLTDRYFHCMYCGKFIPVGETTKQLSDSDLCLRSESCVQLGLVDKENTVDYDFAVNFASSEEYSAAKNLETKTLQDEQQLKSQNANIQEIEPEYTFGPGPFNGSTEMI